MSEIIALTRLSLARSKTFLVIALAYLFLVQLGLGLVWAIGDRPAQDSFDTVIPLACLLSTPLFALTFLCFDYSDANDLGSAATGYLPWLLRTPIQAWKLAAVPITLKTIWVIMICAVIMVNCLIFGSPLERWLAPSIAITCIFSLTCVLTWHPFRSSYSRLALFTLLFIPAGAWLSLAMSLAFVDGDALRPWEQSLITFVWIIALSVYATLFLLAIRSVGLARWNVTGQISQRRPWWASAPAKLSLTSAVKHSFADPVNWSPTRALLRYEFAKSSRWVAKLTAGWWLAIIVLWSLFDDVGPQSLIFLCGLLLIPPMFFNDWMLTNLDGKFLPNLLAVAPISSACVVWTRQVTATATWLASLMGVPIVLGVWSISGSSRHLTQAWQQTTTTRFEAPDAPWRIAAVITLVGFILVVRQATWTVTSLAIGRKGIIYGLIAAKFAIAFAAFGWFLIHFLRLPDLEAWSHWAAYRTAQLRSLLPWLLVIKLALAASSTFLLARSELTRPAMVTALAASYLAVTIVAALVVWRLIPGDDVSILACVAAAAILMPYSRIALAPLALASVRHR